jgi:hypothetical protein
MIDKSENQADGERPIINITPRTVADGLCLVPLQRVEPLLDRIQLFAIGSERIQTAGGVRDGLKCLLIKRIFADRTRVTDGDGVDNDAFIFGDLSGFDRRHFAGGVVPVG